MTAAEQAKLELDTGQAGDRELLKALAQRRARDGQRIDRAYAPSHTTWTIRAGKRSRIMSIRTLASSGWEGRSGCCSSLGRNSRNRIGSPTCRPPKHFVLPDPGRGVKF